MRWLPPCLLFLLSLAAPAATITVGAGGDAPTMAEALLRAQDGDTLELFSGDHVGDVAVITQRRLTIRGREPRPVVHAAGRHAEGKAIWVVRDGDITIDNVEFRGARVPDGNGAGIRFERGRLTLTRCAFIDNEMGLLSANFDDAELRISDSEFGQAPTHAGSLHHLLYVGRIARVDIQRSRFQQGFRGHLIKSRARISRIVGNTIVDGPGGRASYEIDLPNGGFATVEDNLIGQSATPENSAMLAFGAEGHAWSDSRLVLRHNHFVNDGPAAELVRVWRDKLPANASVLSEGNRLTGPGHLPR